MGLVKQGPLFRRLIWALLAGLLAVYALCALLLGGDAPETATASVCKVGVGLSVSGFVVFREKAVGTGRLWPAVATGTHVAAGQCVAWRYEAGQEALCEEKREISDRLAALTASAAGSDAEIKAALHRFALAPSQTAEQMLEKRILRREAVAVGEETLHTAIEAMEQRSKELELPAVNAAESGCFAEKPPSVLTPERLLGISPGEFLQLEAGKIPGCRLITGEEWYFAALLPEERELLPGTAIPVRLTPALTVSMTVERLSVTPEGRLLVLSCREKLAEAAELCSVTARLQFSSCEGLRVPKAAIQYRDGRTGVYVLVAGQKKFKPVELIYEREDDFLAAQALDPAALQPGDEMILIP